MAEITDIEVERFLWKAGARQVARSAAKKLAYLLEERAEKIAKEAIALARHAGRKTIIAKDIVLANEVVNGKRD
jgi:histone H3/H4